MGVQVSNPKLTSSKSFSNDHRSLHPLFSCCLLHSDLAPPIVTCLEQNDGKMTEGHEISETAVHVEFAETSRWRVTLANRVLATGRSPQFIMYSSRLLARVGLVAIIPLWINLSCSFFSSTRLSQTGLLGQSRVRSGAP